VLFLLRRKDMRKLIPIKAAIPPSARVTRVMRERLAEVIDDLRADIGRIDEPQFKAMFETAAEVLGGLVTAFRHYEDKSERAWTRS
jgi:hypothetical protein